MIEATIKQNIIIKWFKWHYYGAVGNLIKAWANFLKFNLNFFSIGLLLKTIFSPWRQYKEQYERGFSPSKWFFVFSGNMVSRVIGAIARILFIILGLIMEIFIFISGIVILILWLALPLVIIILLWAGIHLLIGL